MNTIANQWISSMGSRCAIALSLVISAGCATAPDSVTQVPQQAQSTITVDGSSTVYPITNEIALEYQLLGTEKPQIIVDFSGTGGGFERFCAGQTDINNASRPISTAEMERCKEAGVEYIELPVAYDAITVVVHPENDWAESITLEELDTIWEPAAEGTITQWSQVRSDWPDEPLNLYGPGADSGTFDYFTEAVVGEAGESRNDYTASEDDTLLVRGVSRDPNGLGYFGYSYYEENSNLLKPLAIDSGSGAILPSRETVRSSEYQPLSRPLLIYVNANAVETRPEVREFVDYYLANARHFVKTVGYVPLSDEIYTLAMSHFDNNKVGTVFEGKSQLNLKMEELLQKEAQF